MSSHTEKVRSTENAPGFPGAEPAPDPAPRLGVDCVRVARGNALLSVAVPGEGSARRRCSSHHVCPADNTPSYLTAPVHPIDRSFDVSCVGSPADVVPQRSLPLRV